MPLVLGAGSVGLALAAQLAAAGREVTLLVRRSEAAASLRAGLVAEDPVAGGERRLPVAATDDLAAALTRSGDGAVFVCTREPDSEAVGRALARHGAGAAGGRGAERPDRRRAPRAARCRAWSRPSGARPRRAWPTTACASTAPRRVVLGAEPGCATAADAAALARELAAAGLDAACSERIREDQWLKLCVNLMSAPNALVRPAEHTLPAFVELKARLLEEARDVLAAAGIRAASCDGRDRDLEQEIRFQRASLEGGGSARRAALYNHVWTGLREGRAIEAEAYHRRILALAGTHGVPAPANARTLAALERAVRERLGPRVHGRGGAPRRGAAACRGGTPAVDRCHDVHIVLLARRPPRGRAPPRGGGGPRLPGRGRDPHGRPRALRGVLGVSDSVRQECGLQTLLPELVEAAGPDVVRVSGVPREGRVLVLSIREVHAPGGGPFSGPKWMVVEAELHEQGKLVATARAKRMTTGPFGGTCAHLQKVARAIAVDLGAWLRDPRRGAELGDR